MASLTNNEKTALKNNCKAIYKYLVDLIKDYPVDISINVKFYDRNKSYHENAIYLRKYKHGNDWKIRVAGSSGCLGIILDEETEKISGSSAYAWESVGTNYGIELMAQWQTIKSKILTDYKNLMEDRKTIREFKL